MATLAVPAAALPPAVAEPPAGQAVQTPAAAPMLTVVAIDGVKAEEPGVGKLDFGAVDSLQNAKVEHDFILRNDTREPITIGRLQPTCGCTSVLMGEGNETTKTLAPGEEVKARVSIDITRFRGPIHKAVRAFGPDNTLLATMDITADVQGVVNFSSRQIDFGTVNFGTPASQPLIMTLSPSVPLTGALPKLVSSNPHVVITPMAGKGANASAAMAKAGAAQNERYYSVAVSPKAPIGQLSATLSFDLPPATETAVAPTAGQPTTDVGDGHSQVKIKAVGALDSGLIAALRGTVVIVTADVVGRIAASPSMVVFGNAVEATRQVTLTSASAAILKKLKIRSASPWITARLLSTKEKKQAKNVSHPVPVAGDAGTGNESARATATLEVTLSPKAPVGTLETQLHILTADGEDLSLPVLAEVEPKK
jgi:hypothetical protein